MSAGPPVPPVNQPNGPNQPPVDEDYDGFADGPELFLFPGSQIIVDNDTAVRYPVGFDPSLIRRCSMALATAAVLLRPSTNWLKIFLAR